MKKIISSLIVSGIFMLSPIAIFAATFEHDLYFGMRDSSEVRQLQDFLRTHGSFHEESTGNFFAFTEQALIAFQQKERIVPALGYFGPLTRGKMNAMVSKAPKTREEQIMLLQAQIKELQAKLATLIAAHAQPIPTSTPASTESPSPTSILPSVTPSPVATPELIKEFRISGTSTQPFPYPALIPYKLGDIVIKNTTTKTVGFVQLQLDIYDAMDSSLNRGKTILFKLRNGATTADPLISETNFVVNSEPPPRGEPYHRRQLDISAPINVNSGDTKTISLWIENFDYVISGSLRILLLKAYTNNGAPEGGFDFLLTKP